MKLTPTNTGLKGLKWEYSHTQIDTKDITAIRFAVYDNAPDISHCYEKKRYRGEVQIWTTNDKTNDANYKLYNYFSNYKTYKNCQWKEENDPYLDWYQREVRRAKELNEAYGAQATILHANLGLPREHANRTDGSFGFYNQPQYAFHLIARDDGIQAMVSIDEFQMAEDLIHSSRFKKDCNLYYNKFDVS